MPPIATPPAAHAAPPPASRAVSYRVTPHLVNGRLAVLDVEARFRADPGGRTRLELPDHGGKDKEWWRLLSEPAVANAVIQTTSPIERLLISKPGAVVTVRYSVRSGYDHDPTVDDANPYRPIIRPTWFEVLGDRVFVAPKGRDDAPVVFRWGRLPRGWVAASDLEHSTPQTLDTARRSLLIGGRR